MEGHLEVLMKGWTCTQCERCFEALGHDPRRLGVDRRFDLGAQTETALAAASSCAPPPRPSRPSRARLGGPAHMEQGPQRQKTSLH
eukprot:scaffold222_cov336-Prasinococcus_capsulatus_cf.AAC.2